MKEELNLAMSMLLFVVVALMTTKKTSVFGQMTLRATKALEYLKTTEKPIQKVVTRFMWINKSLADIEDWEMPEWVMKNDNYEWVCICTVADGLPFLVYQKSALRLLEAQLMQLESNGAVVQSEDKGRKLTVDMGDESVTVGFWRNPNGGKFAPFNVQFEPID